MISTARKPLYEPEAVADTMHLLIAPDQITELRALEATTANDHWPHTVSGYFDNTDKLVAALARIRTAKGIYIVLNPVEPALLARAANRIRRTPKGESTQDSNIVRRLWLPVDTDPQRPSGISATDAEREVALERAELICAYLRGLGWPDPVSADSGNGGHLLYRIDLATDDGGLLARCLRALAARFDDERVKIDQTVFNPARIWKLYGTLACKGDDTPDRPHRMSRILSRPEVLQVVGRSSLEALAAEFPTEPTPTSRQWNGGQSSLDLGAFVERNHLNVDGPEDWNGRQGIGKRWRLKHSPLCDHGGDGPFILQHASGAISAGCHHNSCNWNWTDLRRVVEPIEQNGTSENSKPCNRSFSPVDVSGRHSTDNSQACEAGEADVYPSERPGYHAPCGSGGPESPGELPEHLLRPPGLLDEIVEYDLAGAYVPQPQLALAGGIATLATLIARKVRSRFGDRANPQILSISESGSGKDRARTVVSSILNASGNDVLLGAEEYTSDYAVINALHDYPVQVVLHDEFGRTIEKAVRNAKGLEHGIVTQLLKTYTNAGKRYPAKGYARTDGTRILSHAHLILLATSTPDAAFRGLTEDSIADGFVPRMLIFRGDDTADPRDTPEELEPPQHILEVAQFWSDRNPNRSLLNEAIDHWPEPDYQIIEVSPEAETLFNRKQREYHTAGGKAGRWSPLWRRAREKAGKLALCYACSENHQRPEITLAAARWACELVEYVTRNTIYLSDRWIASNKVEADKLRLLRIIEQATKTAGEIEQSALSRKSQGFKSARERHEALSDLVEAGQIECVNRTREGSRKSATFWRATNV